ncbi:MAG: hypothetical protein HYT20_00400 [Candidatus Nealsonbacteria bacterium]|nr:hypothetical protein [Candidatus Nealsonbacteria bacterium]
MEIIFIIWTIIVLFVGMEGGYRFYYSPKAQVNRILKGMGRIIIRMKKAERQSGDKNGFYYNACKDALYNRYEAINDLLNVRHYFDPKDDKEFIQEKRSLVQNLLNNVEEIFNKDKQ